MISYIKIKKIYYFFLYIFEKLNLELNIIHPLIPDDYTITRSQSDFLCLEVQQQASNYYERKLSIVDKKILLMLVCYMKLILF